MALRAGDPVEIGSDPRDRPEGELHRESDQSALAAELQRANAELQRANDRLDAANAELGRENARLARATLGQSDAAAAAQLLRSERELRPQLGDAEARIERLERLLSTPRHQAVERLRDRLMRFALLYGIVRRLWRLVGRRAV